MNNNKNKSAENKNFSNKKGNTIKGNTTIMILATAVVLFLVGVVLWQQSQLSSLKKQVQNQPEEEQTQGQGQQEEEQGQGQQGEEEEQTQGQGQQGEEEEEQNGGETEETSVPEDWKTYTNQNIGFSLRYPPEFEIKEDPLHQNVYYLVKDDKKIYLGRFNTLQAPLFGSFGNYYEYDRNFLEDSEKLGDFTKDYIISSAGMGSWEVVLNAYLEKDGYYYIISLYEEKNYWQQNEDEVVIKELKRLREYTEFDKILATFEFTETE